MKQNQLGNSGTYFWFGVVEDRMDPLKVGRVRVRIYGDHTDNKGSLPTSHLPWSQCVVPTNANEGATSDLKEGSTVFGIYLDGEEKQHPMVLGCVPGLVSKSGSYQQGFNDPREKVTNNYPGKPTLDGGGARIEPEVREQVASGSPTTSPYNSGTGSRWASKAKAAFRKVGALIAGGQTTFDEPADPYGSKYPYNNANETESGHVIELDDTPGKERVHIFHRSGSYIEVHPNGDVVKKSVKDNYEFVSNNEFLSVNGHKIEVVENGSSLRIDNSYEIEVTNGNLQIQVLNGDTNIFVSGNVYAEVLGNVEAQIVGNFDAVVGGDAVATVMKDLSANVIGNCVVNVEGNHTTNVIGDYTVNAANIALNSNGVCETNSAGSYSISCDGNYSVSSPRIDLN